MTISVLLTCPLGTDWLRRERTVESYTWVGSIGLSTLLLLLYDYRRIANVHTAPADFIERGQPSHQTELRIATLILFVLGLSDCQHILYFLWISSLWNNVEFGLFRHLNSFFILTNGLNLRTRRRLIRKWCQAVVASCVVLLMCMGRGREGETRQTNEHSKWKLTTKQPNRH